MKSERLSGKVEGDSAKNALPPTTESLCDEEDTSCPVVEQEP